VRAEQKALRLREWLGQPAEGPLDGVRVWGYGNSSGDHALLEMSDHAYWLGRPAKVPSGATAFTPGPIPD
jgi:phosphoserine phosphatase